MLHAWKLRLRHPVKGVEMAFEAPPPPDMLPYLGEAFAAEAQRGVGMR